MMSKMMRHNKKRNTLFLYEVLIRELTKSIVEENKERKNNIVKTLKRYFSKGKILSREMELYRILSETNGLKESTAKKLLNEVYRVYHNFDMGKMSQEQDEVITTINKDVGKEVFNTYIPNYRNLATIYQLFNRKLNPKEKVILEEKVIESLISQSKEIKEDEIKPIEDIAFRKFVKLYNETYSNELLKEQQELLSKYILSCVDNGTELRIFLNEEIGRLITSLKSAMVEEEAIKTDEEMIKKAKEVLNILENVKNEFEIKPIIVEQLLRIQKLVQEIGEK